jgi:hypothetical protein
MTHEELEQIRARESKATNGPWRYSNTPQINSATWPELKGIAQIPRENDKIFIAHARTDIPALLEYTAKLERENADLKEQAERKVQLREDLKIALEEFQFAAQQHLTDDPEENARREADYRVAGFNLVKTFKALEQDGNV